MQTMSKIAQVDQFNIRKLEMRHAFFKGLTPKNQLVLEESGDFIERKKETNLITTCKHTGSRSYNTAIGSGRHKSNENKSDFADFQCKLADLRIDIKISE